MWKISLPARINIVGSPTDAVEGAYATISAAVDVRGGATVEDGDAIVFRRADGSARSFAAGHIADAQGFAVEAAAVNAFLRHAPELGERLGQRGMGVTTWTDVPASSGMAGSSVLVLAVLAGLRAHYGLCPQRYNDYVLAEIAQRAEEQDMGVVCGFADRYAPVLGDIAYLGYHGKLWHAPLGEEPFVTYEPLGRFCPALTFCVATTGVQRDSGSVHAPMRELYLTQRRAGSGALLDLSRRIGATAWRGKIALLRGDLAELGRQIDLNQQLVDSLMRQCGFAAGAGEEVTTLVRAAKDAGALGAKLTGAGGGGAIFALAAPGNEERVLEGLRRAALQLPGSEVFAAPVTRVGLVVERS
jgi:galactokinase/mevalonate kinase-like predicted kinase